jgi:hypothetical protein
MQTNTTDRFQVEHVEYVSERPFDDVVAASPTPSSARPPESWTPSLRRSWSA